MIKLLKNLKKTSFSSQKGSLILLLKFGGVSAAFLLFFMPIWRDYGIVTSNTKALRGEIEDLKKISTNLLTPEELAGTEERLRSFESNMVESGQAGKVLDFLSEQAEQHHLNVVQIYSDSPVTAKDETGKELEFKGKKLMVLPVNFRVETDFKSLANFLRSVKENIKANVVVESMVLKKSSPDSERLQCDVTLSCVVV